MWRLLRPAVVGIARVSCNAVRDAQIASSGGRLEAQGVCGCSLVACRRRGSRRLLSEDEVSRLAEGTRHGKLMVNVMNLA